MLCLPSRLFRFPCMRDIVRSSVLQVKEQDFVSASRGTGRLGFWDPGQPRSAECHYPCHCAGNLGNWGLPFWMQRPFPSWVLARLLRRQNGGLCLGEERNSLFNAPHLVFIPGIAIMLTVLAFNLLGDGLRDALDPSR